MRTSPNDGRLDCRVNGLPTDVKAGRRFFPAQHLGPTGQKPRQRRCHSALALSPRKQLDLHTTARAITTSGCVDKEHGDGPKGNELVEASLQTVVGGAFLAASGTNRLGPLPFPQRHVDMQGRAPTDEMCPLENKTGLPLDSIQDSL